MMGLRRQEGLLIFTYQIHRSLFQHRDDFLSRFRPIAEVGTSFEQPAHITFKSVKHLWRPHRTQSCNSSPVRLFRFIHTSPRMGSYRRVTQKAIHHQGVEGVR